MFYQNLLEFAVGQIIIQKYNNRTKCQNNLDILNIFGNFEVMKVLYIINTLKMGGAPRLVTDIALRIAEKPEMEVGLLTFEDSEDSALYKNIASHPTLKLYDLSKEKPGRARIIKKIRQVSKEYDIIHAHLFPSGYYTVMAARGLGKPIFYTEHSTHNRRRDKKFLRPLERLVYSKYTIIAAISEPVNNSLAEWLRSAKIASRIVTIENGVDLSFFRDSISPDGSLENTLPVNGRTRLIMVARFTASKDHATVMRAVSLLKDKDIELVFVGDGDTMESCKEIAGQLELGERCIFLGSRHDIPKLLKESHIGIQSSNWEGFGLAAVEMMASGLPVIASDVSGLSDVARGAGLLFPKGDAEALADRITELLDPMRYNEIREKCLKRAAKYDLSQTVEGYIRLYKDLKIV